MNYYVYMLMILYSVAFYKEETEDKPLMLGSFLLFLPVFGRILNWW